MYDNKSIFLFENNGKIYIGFISKALIRLKKVIHHLNCEETEIMKMQSDFLGKIKAFGGGVVIYNYFTFEKDINTLYSKHY